MTSDRWGGCNCHRCATERYTAAGLSRRYEPGDPGPIPTEPQIREPGLRRNHAALAHPDGDGLQLMQHMAATRLAQHERARLWPLLALVFVIAFIASCSTLVLSALSPTPGHRVQSDLTMTVDGSAVRASESPLGERVGVCMEIAACDDPRTRSASVPSDSPARAWLPNEPTPTVTRARTDARGSDPSTIRAIIRAAALEFGQDPDELIRVSFCESSHRPDAIGDGGLAVGLWLFHIWRWQLNAPRLGYLEDLRADPVASSRVAAYAFSTGQRSAWTCRG